MGEQQAKLGSILSAKMKFLWILVVVAVLVAADDDDDDDVEETNIIPATELPTNEVIDVGTSSTAGRSRSRRPNRRQNNNRSFFGGLGNLLGAGVGALIGGALGGGVRPPRPGFGGVNPGFGGPVTGGCRYWCRTPFGQRYCCENSNQGQGGFLPFTKPGQCPPVRPSCPPTRNFIGPPQTCSSDSRCPGVDKCCFDTCLQEHVCKPPQGFGK